MSDALTGELPVTQTHPLPIFDAPASRVVKVDA